MSKPEVIVLGIIILAGGFCSYVFGREDGRELAGLTKAQDVFPQTARRPSVDEGLTDAVLRYSIEGYSCVIVARRKFGATIFVAIPEKWCEGMGAAK